MQPNADGTHSFTTGDFQDNTSTNIATSATNVFSLLNEAPPNLTAFAKQVVIRSTSYLEVAFPSLPATVGTPVFVELKAALHPVGSNAANTSMFRLNDGGVEDGIAVADASLTADTLEYHKHGYQVRPNGGGAWDTASVNALRARFGYSTDVTPPPAIDTLFLQALAPITLTPGRSMAQII